MTLSYSKKVISIIKRNNLKNNGVFFFFELSSFLYNKKTTTTKQKTKQKTKKQNKLKLHKNVCENKYFCNVLLPSEETKILEINRNQKSNKAPFIIFVDLECTTRKTDECKNNPENSSST